MSDIVYDPAKGAWCHLPSGSCSTLGEAPQLPTYRTIAAVLEKKTGSGIRLAGWTVARTALIFPFMMLAGAPTKKALLWSVIASCAISSLALLRLQNAEYELNRDYLAGRKWLKPKTRATRRLTA